MYESPIKLYEVEARIIEDIVKARDDYILAQVKMAVDVDKEELIKALSYDRQQYDKGYADGYANAKAAGKWILVTDSNGQHCVCDHCGEWKYHQRQKFCGECGAKMEEGDHNADGA